MTINSPPLTNTLKELLFQYGITQARLADEAGVTRHAVLRLTQLCYPTPLPSVISSLALLTGLSEEALNTCYEEDIKANRVNTGELYFDTRSVRIAYQHGLSNRGPRHPFATFRSHLIPSNPSRIHWCSLVSVHPATMDRYESFKTGLPKPLEVALVECNLDREILGHLMTDIKYNVTYGNIRDD